MLSHYAIELHRPITPGDPTPQPPGQPAPIPEQAPPPVTEPPPVRASAWGCSRQIVEGYDRQPRWS
ncbi:hypothetical protein DFR29_101253 [Tahibacter aquaticus]|uniref:Uncharacterized protein n=1 Tax=Tahibacter aquaticus TaxID=520092 RepID=A0A4R6Z9P5_9GAMM|nr:hypothetical protein [Tahibacter aquaticus]TDR48633.1 hypothetical protein DFR29_101253 [Tahibacter aquaticus]